MDYWWELFWSLDFVDSQSAENQRRFESPSRGKREAGKKGRGGGRSLLGQINEKASIRIAVKSRERRKEQGARRRSVSTGQNQRERLRFCLESSENHNNLWFSPSIVEREEVKKMKGISIANRG